MRNIKKKKKKSGVLARLINNNMNYHTYSIGNFMSSSILTSRYLAPEFRPVEKVITKSTKQTK